MGNHPLLGAIIMAKDTTATTNNNSQSSASDGATTTEQSNDKRVKLGFIPAEKLSGIVGAKNLTEFRKAQEQIVQARETLAKRSIGMSGRDQSESLVAISRCAQPS